jgi:murein DD-endopeptidase MepM/ murein hydrolase activator NlpD
MKWFVLLLIVSLEVQGQNKYPQGYFRNPLNIPILLAGNFGECRPGHFHSGIDIKTEGKENFPVFAAADGYVSRVKMEPGGFGHGIYIKHPNGYTTLYAHLNDFFPSLQKAVRNEQYEKKEWTCDLSFSPDKFPIKKGQQIAWSGNTGGSSAPHLHFEIRNSITEHPLNPQLFGFEIKDNIEPIPAEIALYNADESIYSQNPILIKLKKEDNFYSPIKDTIRFNGKSIHLGIAVNDYMENSNNTLSFFTAEWYANDSLIGQLKLDDIGYEETRYLNACADYKLKKETEIWFNSLFLLPNNKLNRIYSSLQNKSGSIQLSLNKPTLIRIVLKDVSGNKSEIKISVIGAPDLQKEICPKTWRAGEQHTFENPNLKFSLPETSLYDDVCPEIVQFSKPDLHNPSPEFMVNLASIPVHDYFSLNIKPDVMIPFSLMDKIALRHYDGKKTTGKKTSINGGWYSTSVRAFGDYWLEVDSTAPSIKPMQKNGIVIHNKGLIKFEVKDDISTIKKFTGTINGQWLCFEQHENYWFYRIDPYCPIGKNKLQLIAIDENGNEKKIEYYFTLSTK